MGESAGVLSPGAWAWPGAVRGRRSGDEDEDRDLRRWPGTPLSDSPPRLAGRLRWTSPLAASTSDEAATLPTRAGAAAAGLALTVAAAGICLLSAEVPLGPTAGPSALGPAAAGT